MTAVVRASSRPFTPVCTAFRFDINVDDFPEPIIVGTGGPGLGWTYALNEAVRLHCKRRGDLSWRSVRGRVVDDLPLSEALGLRIVAHVLVKTSRHVEPTPSTNGHRANAGAPDLLDVWVRRVGPEDLEKG